MDSLIDDILRRMQANDTSIKGNLFFIPKQYLSLLNLLEDYIEAISKENLSNSMVHSNSMFVVDDERQRQKMTAEFYANYKRDIEFYQDRIQHFIDSGCESQAVIQRWMDKIGALQKKKKTYEEVLKQQLDDLNSDYAMLQMQARELLVRKNKDQLQIAAYVALMEDYNVTIKEILERVISVSAETPEEAEYMVRQDYKNQLHILDSSNFTGVTFTVQKA